MLEDTLTSESIFTDGHKIFSLSTQLWSITTTDDYNPKNGIASFFNKFRLSEQKRQFLEAINLAMSGSLEVMNQESYYS